MARVALPPECRIAETAYDLAKDGVIEGWDPSARETEADNAACAAGRRAWQKAHEGRGRAWRLFITCAQVGSHGRENLKSACIAAAAVE
jgi:hypothetical protein